MTELKTELVVLQTLELVPFFTKGDSVDETLKAIEVEALAFVGDVSTKKGRDAIKAMVTKVTKSKTYLESNGKDLAAEYKAIPKAIDATRKKTKDFLTELQAKVRLPLTEWEVEQERIKVEELAAAEAAEIAERIELIWDYAHTRLELFNLGVAMTADHLAEQQRLHEEKIAFESAEKARIKAEQDAEEKVKAAQDAADKIKQDAIDKEIEHKRLAKIAVIDSAHGEALLELRDINDAIAEKKRKADKIIADKLAEDNERANVARALAAQTAKQEADKKIADAELASKRANTENRNKVHIAMKQHLVSFGVDGDVATAIVKSMGSDEMPHVTVNY